MFKVAPPPKKITFPVREERPATQLLFTLDLPMIKKANSIN